MRSAELAGCDSVAAGSVVSEVAAGIALSLQRRQPERERVAGHSHLLRRSTTGARPRWAPRSARPETESSQVKSGLEAAKIEVAA